MGGGGEGEGLGSTWLNNDSRWAIFSTVWPVFIIAYNFTQLTSLDIEGNGTEQKMAGNIHYVLIPTSKS